jgi:Cu2+-exporting ATPase
LRLIWDRDSGAARIDDYIKTLEGLGYQIQPYDPQAQEGSLKSEERFLLLCLGVAAFAAGNIMLLSVGLWTTSTETMGLATRDFMHWISAAIALPAILFSGRVFFRSAWQVLKAGHTNMDVPISLALILAGGMSLHETIRHGEHVYFDSAVMLMFFLLIGRYLDFRARKAARSSATNLLSRLNGFATILEDGQPRRILIGDVKPDMVLRVAAGEMFSADGVVLDGVTEIDTSLMTGETVPRAAKAGDALYAGTLNMGAPITMRVEQAAERSVLADIAALMDKATQGQAKYVRIADRAAQLYTPVVHILALAAFIGWWGVGGIGWQSALMIAVTVLIITCPCALGLAVPVVQVLASGRLMKKGVLVKSGDALERLARIDTILLDKTGTLTLGKPSLDGPYNEAALQLAASLAAHSSHPLSKALMRGYDGDVLDITEAQEHPGLGVSGLYEGREVRLGRQSWCGDKTAPVSGQLELWLQAPGQVPQVFYFMDHIRQDAKEAISAFKAEGITPIMLSGDRQAVARDIAKISAIEIFHAEQTPPQKFAVLEVLKQGGHHVLMVGDGLNDAPVLVGADISIAPGSAIDMAQNAADIIFMGDKFMPVYEAYKTARLTQNLVRQNFALAVIYNIIAVPFALCGLVTPLVAAIAMSGSSLLVIANSFRLGVKK